MREAGILGNRSLTFTELDRQFASGAQVVTRSSNEVLRPDEVMLVSVAGDGRLNIAADGRPPEMQPGDTVILFVGDRSPEASGERADQTRDRVLRSS